MDRQQHIHTAVLHGVGQIPRYELFPAPAVGVGEDAGDVVLTVAAAAIKPFDLWSARGAHWSDPGVFPQVVGADGVGRLDDGSRVAFFGPRRPYGGMAERPLLRRGLRFPVPDAVDDVTAAAVLNPGGAAWKSVVWEGGLTAGQSVLILGATGASGRIAAQMAVGLGARVVVAGRNRQVLDRLVAGGAQAAITLDRPRGELAGAIAAEGPYDLIVDYLWEEPAEAAFAALPRMRALSRAGVRAGTLAGTGTGAGASTGTGTGAAANASTGPGGGVGPALTRCVLVGMSVGEVAALPAVVLRGAAVDLIGSGTRGPAPLAQAAQAYGEVLRRVTAGEIALDIEAVPLAEVERVWPRAGSERRIVFVP